jgi:AGCS family alanine or glycine:cation symporter
MSKSNNDDSESITPKPIETFYSAVATTAGIGNISGVATAIIVTGFIGMIIKMAEVTLAVYYRAQTEDGYFESSPMHYIEKGIGKGMNFGSLKIPIYLFAIGLFSTVPFTIQNYYASVSISSSLNIPALAVSLVYAAIVYITIFKGISSYGKVMKNIFPIVILIYIASGILVILFNMSYIIPSIKLIFQDAFNFGSITGGIAGKSIAEVMKQGISRGLYSNESGWGTSPMLHSQANTDHPVKLGLWGVIEVFIDTIVICVTTGNDGDPIPKETLNHLFEKFHKGRDGNFGLGLFIAKKVIEHHHGTITAENKNHQVVFKISLQSS